MRGVRRQIILLFLLLCWIGSVRLADAVELSNMIFPSVAEQSREASARALDAIGTALRGIAEIERNRLDASRELLRQSSAQLNDAAHLMDEILSKANTDKDFLGYLNQEAKIQDLSESDRAFVVGYLVKSGLLPPKTRSDAFALFIKKTMTLSASLQQPQPHLSDISDYLKFGAIVTNLMR
jgi:hypothetical protein